MFRPALRSLSTIVAAAVVASCADVPTAAVKQPGSRGAHLSLAPVFTPGARAAAQRLADFGITFDHVRIKIVRPPAETVKDTTIVFAPGQPDVTLDLTVDVRADGESFRASIDYTNPSGVVFHGEGIVQSHAADTPASPQRITVEYTGPGATVTHIAVSPKTTSIVAPATQTFTVSAFDANNAPVASVPVSWTSSDPTVATISNSGTLTTTGKRGTVTVTATTPTNATDNASVTIRLGTAGIVLVSGGGQRGKVGSTLAQAAVVRVVASDGVGVAGAGVVFTPPTGGKVGSASTITDANGQASVTMTLGGVIGLQSFAAATGGFSVGIPATATVGDPASIAAVAGQNQLDTVRRTLGLPLTVRVADAFDNPVPDATVNWLRGKGSGVVSTATSLTGADGRASVQYTLGALAGFDTITASIAGVSQPAIFSAEAAAGAPTVIVITAGDQQIARILQPLAPFVIKVTDDNGNPIKGAVVAWAAVNGTLNPTTTTDAQGVTSNTMTVGGVAGTASATATIGGKTTRFTATVQTGLVAKIAFQNGPPAFGPALVVFTPAIQVALQDAGGNLTPSTNAVTIAIGTNSSGGTLRGTLTRNAVAGIATFDDLTIDRAGVGYTLVVTSANAGSAVSTPFNITATLFSVVPAAIDAAFLTVPFTLTGAGFAIGGTVLNFTTGQLANVTYAIQGPTTIVGSVDVISAGSASTGTMTVSTQAGVSNALAFSVFAAGTAPVQVGVANGGGGGTPYSLDCPAGELATGLNVRGGANVDQIQVICQSITGVARTFGSATTTGTAGGTGGQAVTLACPATYVLVGLTGRIGNGGGGLNDQIAGVCAPLLGGATVVTASVGSNFSGSIGYTTTCPAGLAVGGIQGGAGNLVDRTQIKCR